MPIVDRYYTQCIGLAVIALGFFVYSNTLTGEFVWDDVSSILLHHTVQDPQQVLQLFQEDQHAYAGGQGNFYRPLLALTFMADFWLSYSGPSIKDSPQVITELSPLLFHLDSILWHCLAAVFFMLFLKNFDAPVMLQAVAPLIYVVHPLHTEAVAYISGRADSMSAAFMFAGLYCATKKSEGKGELIAAALVILCFLAGLLSKESSFIFPLLLLLSYGVSNKIYKQKWKPAQGAALICTLIILGIYALLRTGNGPLNFGSDSRPPDSSFLERIVETAQSFAYYIQLLFVPGNLHMERTLVQATSTMTALGFLSLMICLVIAGYGFLRKRYRLFLAAAWFLITWLPISGLVPLNAPMAEHWMYVPMAGFLWMVLELLLDVWAAYVPPAFQNRYRYTVCAFVGVWGILLGTISIDRNLDWHTNVSIYEATLRQNPKSIRVHFNLAVTYYDLLQNNDGAKRHFTEVLAIHREMKENDPSRQSMYWDNEMQSHFSLAQIYMEDNQYNEAVKHFGILSTIVPNDSNRNIVGRSLYGLGQCILYSGDQQQAQQFFDKAIEVLPSLEQEIMSRL